MQLDIYGEMLDSFFHAQHKMGRHTEDDFRVLVLLLKHLEKIWEEPDEGIWETRGGPQQFTYSKLMAWVAFDRAVLIADQLMCEAPVDRWKHDRPLASSARPTLVASSRISFVTCRSSQFGGWCSF